MIAEELHLEAARAKVNLVLRVGAPRTDGLHPLCSLFAVLELCDDVVARRSDGPADEIVCRGVRGENLAARAVDAFRAEVPDLPPLRIEIDKRIPVAAGLGGGSADAAAVLRLANAIAGSPLSPDRLRAVAASIGSDVPSQVEPRHAVVTGVGERVEPVDLPPMSLVLLPQAEGLSTAEAYAELDRLGHFAPDLEPAPLRELAGGSVEDLARGLSNDLQAAALSLRPELAGPIEALLERGALAAQVTGSGPTVFGVFADRTAAERAAQDLPDAILTDLLR